MIIMSSIKTKKLLKRATKIDLDKYIGEGKSEEKRTWKQVAAFPAWFQKDERGKPLQKVTATYTKKKGFVEVKNSGVESNGEKETKIGKATTTSKPNVLKVKFSPIQPGADYIIEFVDVDYKYAIVGSTGKAYLWILARGRVTQDIYDQLISIAKRKGYEVDRLEKTKQ